MYLAHGASTHVQALKFRIGHKTIRKIIRETCTVLWKELKSRYLLEKPVSEWSKISKDYLLMWNMPNCVGSIDGKHINIVCLKNTGSVYFNYKNRYCIILMATCVTQIMYLLQWISVHMGVAVMETFLLAGVME